jgi:hypothetical protein
LLHKSAPSWLKVGSCWSFSPRARVDQSDNDQAAALASVVPLHSEPATRQEVADERRGQQATTPVEFERLVRRDDTGMRRAVEICEGVVQRQQVCFVLDDITVEPCGVEHCWPRRV